jgi:AcrR family transcriptional regulator
VRDPARTRRVIVEALLAALDEPTDGEPAPTARALAARAGVSERSVFVHFADLDELRVAAAGHQLDQVRALLEPVPAGLPLSQRVDVLLGQQERIYPLLGRLAALARTRTSEPLDARLREGEKAFRAHLAAVFADELDDELLALLEPLAGWAVRHHLVQRRNFTNSQASRSIRRAVLAVLEPSTPRS